MTSYTLASKPNFVTRDKEADLHARCLNYPDHEGTKIPVFSSIKITAPVALIKQLTAQLDRGSKLHFEGNQVTLMGSATAFILDAKSVSIEEVKRPEPEDGMAP